LGPYVGRVTQIGPVVAPNCPSCLLRCDLDDIGYLFEECLISLSFWDYPL